MIRVLFLDLMDTVLHDPYAAALTAATGLDLPALARLRDPAAWPLFEAAAIDEAEFFRRFFRDDGHAIDVAVFHEVRRAGYRFLPGMAELLDALEGRVERHLASNYPAWIDELLPRFALDRRCEGVHASAHLGVRKPDEAFYRRILAAVDAPAETCLFVDDRASNCVAAERVGMMAHHFDGAAGLVDRLRREGVDVAVAGA